MAHKFVDEFTNKKMLIFGDTYEKEMKELIAPEQLEKRYGGEAENAEDNFWPPKFNLGAN